MEEKELMEEEKPRKKRVMIQTGKRFNANIYAYDNGAIMVRTSSSVVKGIPYWQSQQKISDDNIEILRNYQP